MTDFEFEEYEENEAEEFALAMAQNEEKCAIKKGLSNAEALKLAQEKYNEVRKRHALEFLKKVEERLSSLSNQAVADLLRILIALGLDIEDEEELEAWINRLSLEAFNRINLYFNERDNISLYCQLTTKAKTQKVLYNLKNYSIKDIEILKSMIKSLNEVNDKKTKNDKSRLRRKDILQKIDKTLDKDINLKKQQNQRNAQAKPRQEKRESKDNSMKLLTDKMTAEGVEQGGRYWNEVISDYNRSADKNDFANSWQIDHNLHNELDIKSVNDKQREEERGLAEKEEHQRLEQENLRQHQEQESYLKQQEQQQDINLQQAALNKQALNDKQKRQLENLMEKRGIKENKEKNNENKSNQSKTEQKIAQLQKAGGGKAGR